MDQDNKNNQENEYPKTIIQDEPYGNNTLPSPALNPEPASQPSQPEQQQSTQNTTPPTSQSTESTEKAPSKGDSPMQLILQWLTYAFWGWTVLALSVLTTSVIASFVGDADTGGFTPYGIAAILVLLPISYVTDYFFSKNEQSKKTGVAIAIMVIHAVIFALFGIGSLILAVIMIVNILTNSGENTAAKITLYSSLIVFIYYVTTFLRTLNPAKMPYIKKAYKIFMLVTVGIIALLGLIGPFAKERSMRQDKLITSNLYTVNSEINNYTKSNRRLPESLNDVSFRGDAANLVEQGLVVYKPEGRDYTYYSSSKYKTEKYKYQLCVVYKHQSSRYPSNTYSTYKQDDYSSTVSTYSHPAGEVCYKLFATVY